MEQTGMEKIVEQILKDNLPHYLEGEKTDFLLNEQQLKDIVETAILIGFREAFRPRKLR